MQKKSLMNIFILGLLLSVSLVSIVQFADFVSADAVTDWLGKTMGTALDNYSKGEGIGDGFARFLFGVIIALLVFSVIDNIPGLKSKTWINGIIAAIVGFLGTAYLVNGELRLLLLSYSALGFTLGFILPFVIMIFFSYDLSKSVKNYFVKILIIRLTWLAFILFGFYKLIRLGYDAVGGGTAVQWISIAIWILIAIAVCVVIFTKWIIKRIIAGETASYIDEYRTKVGKQSAKTDADAAAVDEVGS